MDQALLIGPKFDFEKVNTSPVIRLYNLIKGKMKEVLEEDLATRDRSTFFRIIVAILVLLPLVCIVFRFLINQRSQ